MDLLVQRPVSLRFLPDPLRHGDASDRLRPLWGIAPELLPGQPRFWLRSRPRSADLDRRYRHVQDSVDYCSSSYSPCSTCILSRMTAPKKAHPRVRGCAPTTFTPLSASGETTSLWWRCNATNDFGAETSPAEGKTPLQVYQAPWTLRDCDKRTAPLAVRRLPPRPGPCSEVSSYRLSGTLR